MKRFEDQLGRILFEDESRDENNTWTESEITEARVEQILRRHRIFTMGGGGVLALGPADKDMTELGAELGFRHSATYSLQLGHAPGRPGFTDEQEWTRAPCALTPIARKVAFEQQSARRAA